MRPQIRSTLIFSLLGFSLALNVAFIIGFVKKSQSSEDLSPVRSSASDYCLLDHLKLDAEQQRLLVKMRHEMHKKRSSYWHRARAIKGELAETISTVPANQEALNVQLARYAKNQAAMQRAVAEHLISVNAMLRPEQGARFRTLLRSEMFSGIHSSPNKTVDEP